MANNHKKGIIYIVVGIVAALVLIICFFIAFVSIVNVIDDESTVVNTIPDGYKNLFIKKDSLISEGETHVIYKNMRFPVSDFLYNNKYYVTITKLKTMAGVSTLPLIEREIRESETNYYGSFDGFPVYFAEFDYKLHPLIASRIFLTLYGDSIKQVYKTDYLSGYYFKTRKFSLKYQANGPVDLYMDTHDRMLIKPATILLFLEKNNSLYLIYIVPRNPADNLNPSIINKIINMN